jgi:hypothetical protein
VLNGYTMRCKVMDIACAGSPYQACISKPCLDGVTKSAHLSPGQLLLRSLNPVTHVNRSLLPPLACLRLDTNFRVSLKDLITRLVRGTPSGVR